MVTALNEFMIFLLILGGSWGTAGEYETHTLGLDVGNKHLWTFNTFDTINITDIIKANE